MRAFIVRPFGTKNEIDFDRVEKDLISPALEALGIEGRTTIDILKQGNIQVDMFQRLLTADLVVADVSIHNANVFYELGIRHSLREKRTFLLRCDADRYPFDLQTNRYFVYKKNDPAASLKALIAALKQTLASEDQDSPVFRLLPNMEQQDRSKFLAVPIDFKEEVELAARGTWLGDLELLAEEAKGFEWESEGLRVVGRKQFDLKAHRGARNTWEAVRSLEPEDLEANTLLGTIYQRLGDLGRSDLALDRVLKRRAVAGKDRSEALSLKARNAKACWKADWEGRPPEQQREEALLSSYLERSIQAYCDAFDEALNHFYPGLNALGLLRILIELATELSEAWTGRFETEDEAARELAKRQEQARNLAAAVEISLKAAKARNQREQKSDVWMEIGEADLCVLTSKSPSRVANAYRHALAGAPAFAVDAARSQLEIYRQLEILKENVAAGLARFPPPAARAEEKKRILLFTGHMIDAPSRKEPRFPPDKEKVAREAIRKAIEDELQLAPIAFGVAGGASGGDILFHEVCAEKGIPTRLYLALPKDQYIVHSVQPAGAGWEERFNRLSQQHPEVRVLAGSKELPKWLSGKADKYTIWQRNNLWILYNTLAEQDQEVTLIALWNGQKGDGPGGTADLVSQARTRGAKTILLDTRELFGIG